MEIKVSQVGKHCEHKHLCTLISSVNRAICRVSKHMTGRRFAVTRRRGSQSSVQQPVEHGQETRALTNNI
jgi:hypothetical protein